MTPFLRSRRYIPLLSMTLIAVTLSPSSPSAEAHPSNDPNWRAGTPKTRTLQKEHKTLYKRTNEQSWQKGRGGGTGSNGFYYSTYGYNYKVRWYLGDMQGVYKLSVMIPYSSATPNLTARATYYIYEKRVDESHYHRVASFRINQGTSKGWRRFRSSFELDGKVYVEVRRQQGYPGQILAADSVRLNFVNLLPEHISSARNLCEYGLDRALKRWGIGIPASISAAVLIVYIGPAAIVQSAKNTWKRQVRDWINTLSKGAQRKYKDLLIKGTKKGLQDVAKDWLLKGIGGLFAGIYHDAFESYAYGCRQFRSGGLYRPWTFGYGSYADDIAAIVTRRKGSHR